MKIEFDPVKNAKNIEDRNISFEQAIEFDFESAFIWSDVRYDYRELRFCALGYINDRLYSLVFTPRGQVMRVISLRKANQREVKLYVRKKNTGTN